MTNEEIEQELNRAFNVITQLLPEYKETENGLPMVLNYHVDYLHNSIEVELVLNN